MEKDPARRRYPLADRVIEVVDDTLTGEVLLDEALKMMKTSEKMSVSSWIDLMSGKLLDFLSASFIHAHIIDRGDVEPHENRLSVETSPRKATKGSGR